MKVTIRTTWGLEPRTLLAYENISKKYWHRKYMMTSSNGNIFRVTGHLCGEFNGLRWILHTQRPMTRSFHVFFDLRLNKPLSKLSWGWWFETLSGPLWRHIKEQISQDDSVEIYSYQPSYMYHICWMQYSVSYTLKNSVCRDRNWFKLDHRPKETRLKALNCLSHDWTRRSICLQMLQLNQETPLYTDITYTHIEFRYGYVIIQR